MWCPDCGRKGIRSRPSYDYIRKKRTKSRYVCEECKKSFTKEQIQKINNI